MSKILLLDGHSLAYRAFYALPLENFATATGQHTNAIYGFASMLINLLAEQKPDRVIVAFDHSRKTFRSERFSEYKANRAKTPDEFRSQIDYINELVRAFNIPIVQREGYEADDLIATITRTAEREDESNRVFITTGDRDSFQLINERVTVLYPMKGVTDLAEMTPDAVLKKYGITPGQYPDFAALRGDPSDNLPSIPGVGEKTAVKWIQEFGSLKKLVEGADQIPGKVGESLRSHISQVLLNRDLTQLVADVPFEPGLLTKLVSDAWHGINKIQVRNLFNSLEIKALRDRLEKLPSSEDSSEEVESVSAVSGENSTSSPAKGRVGKSVEKVSCEEVEESVARQSIDGEFACIAQFSLESGLWQIAISPSAGRVLWWRSQDLPDWLDDKDLPPLFGHGVKNFLKSLSRPLDVSISFDTELAAYLLNPGARDLSIETLLESELGILRAVAPTDLFSSQSFDPLLASDLWLLRDYFSTRLEERGASDLLMELEIPLTKILADLERVGIGFDENGAETLRQQFADELEKESRSAFEIAGHEFNVNSPKQLQQVLFEELKLPKTKRIKSGYSTDADSLTWLHQESGHPLLTSLLRIREVGKLQTVLDGLLNASVDGRIHTIFQQSVTATGRLSSTEPNLQNIPIRTEAGRKIRDCFIAKEPYQSLMTADYSQIEMRIMAHLSGDQHLIEAFNSGEDLHNSVAGLVFGVKPGDVDAEMRRTIKAMSYGLAYGLSAFGLAQQLDLSPSQAQKLMDDYFSRFGGIRDYLHSVVKEARSRGYTETLLGRRRYLPDLASENRQRREMAERMALNAPIQGSAADIIKSAMLIVSDALARESLQSRMLLQVHDELIFEVAKGEAERLESVVRSSMREAYPLDVPLEVNVGIGRSWDQAAH